MLLSEILDKVHKMVTGPVFACEEIHKWINIQLKEVKEEEDQDTAKKSPTQHWKAEKYSWTRDRGGGGVMEYDRGTRMI